MSEPILKELLYGIGAHANPIACVEDLSANLAGRLPQTFSIRFGICLAHEFLDGLHCEARRNLETALLVCDRRCCRLAGVFMLRG